MLFGNAALRETPLALPKALPEALLGRKQLTPQCDRSHLQPDSKQPGCCSRPACIACMITHCTQSNISSQGSRNTGRQHHVPHPPSGPPRSDGAAAATSSWKRTRLRALLRAASSSSSPDTLIGAWE